MRKRYESLLFATKPLGYMHETQAMLSFFREQGWVSDSTFDRNVGRSSPNSPTAFCIAV